MSNPWRPISELPGGSNDVLTLANDGYVRHCFKLTLSDLHVFTSLTHFQPFIAPEPSYGFEEWAKDRRSITNDSRSWIRISFGCVNEGQAKEIWTAAQAALKGGKE